MKNFDCTQEGMFADSYDCVLVIPNQRYISQKEDGMSLEVHLIPDDLRMMSKLIYTGIRLSNQYSCWNVLFLNCSEVTLYGIIRFLPVAIARK